MHVDPERVLEVVARQRAQAVRTEELVLVEHAGEDAPQLGLVEHGEHAASVEARHAHVVDRLEQLGHRLHASTQSAHHVVAEMDAFRGQDRRRAQRQQADHRTHLETLRGAVGQAEDVVEEAVLLVPELVVVVADAVHRGGDEREVLGELQHHLAVHRVVLGELEGDAEHALREEGHPRGAV